MFYASEICVVYQLILSFFFSQTPGYTLLLTLFAYFYGIVLQYDCMYSKMHVE